MYRSLGQEDQGLEIARILDRRGVSSRELIHELLENLDVHAYLRDAGLDAEELAELRLRLVDL